MGRKVPGDRKDEHKGSPLWDIGRAARTAPALLWQTDSVLSVWLLMLQTLQALAPLAQLWVAKLIIDRVVASLRLAHPSHAGVGVLWLIALGFGLAALGLVLRETVNVLRHMLAEKLTRTVSTRILTHTQQLDLDILERPEFYDRLRRAEESAFYRPAVLLVQLLTLLQGGVTLLGVLVLLVRLQPLALPLLLITAVPYALVQSGTATRTYTLAMGQTPESRQARYVSQLLSTDAGAKEIRVFGLSDHLLAQYRSILLRHERQLATLALRRGVLGALAALLPAAAYAGVLAYFCLQALNAHITVGDLTLYIGLVWRSQDALQQTANSVSGIVENGLFLEDYRAFLRLRPEMPTNAGGPCPPAPIVSGVRFERVTYRYPGTVGAALHDVSLELRTGETVAIVGENGAGKTTLVKLLARLYDPQSGRITVDGRDLQTLDLPAWRRQIAVIFQDFLHYYFTVAENIGFGQVEALHDEARIASAAARGGADDVVSRLPRGYRTILGRWFAEGAQLSGGEWQRIALARAFMRDAPVLVLDEPTASLDARTEFEVFQRFRELTRGRIVLLISHRFSTVRMADHIYVLDGGRIIESGSHEELIHRGGRYAELFHLQAAGYR